MPPLQFAPWASDIELAFYSALASLKLNHDKLDDSARKVLGLYEVRPNDPPERSCRMQIHGTALTTDDVPAGFYRAEGIIRNMNTFEDFRSLDKAAVQERAARIVWDAIRDATVYSCPSLLASFSAVCFADLKKYRFTYHFTFPAIHSDPPWTVSEEADGISRLSAKETSSLVETLQTWKYGVDARQHGFFLAKRIRNGKDSQPTSPGLSPSEGLDFVWSIGSLSSYEGGFFKDTDPMDCLVCFADPSTFPGIPGWPLRNLLVLVRQRWRLERVRILCYRDTRNHRDEANSIILDLRSTQGSAPSLDNQDPTAQLKTSPPPKTTGWERNDNGKLNNRVVDLAEYLNPERLADQAVDLNLKLIKWRIAPSINLDVVKETKCLLLGAGTLGSYVSRNLLGWGVRKITLVDNANVSFSNPVRQPLFDFKDCLDGGAKKAHRAAEALSEIYPGVDANGHVMSVPMAGHPITDEANTKKDFELLQKLIDSHDAIFLLMDSRESRWLPTVMGKAAGKIVMNAALGFESFVVMRHGLKAEGPGEAELGCYFCNDVVAPADSQKDATLDQQCTVTRPGVAPIASALLVELLVSVLQHPLRATAPASPSVRSTSSENPAPAALEFSHPLGIVPHQLRGYLSSFSILPIAGAPFDSCSACSDRVLTAYRGGPWEFVKRALNEKGWVEEVSGLAEVQRLAEEADAALGGWEEDDEGIAEEEGEGELL